MRAKRLAVGRTSALVVRLAANLKILLGKEDLLKSATAPRLEPIPGFAFKSGFCF